jgi:hypothetical protein
VTGLWPTSSGLILDGAHAPHPIVPGSGVECHAVGLDREVREQCFHVAPCSVVKLAEELTHLSLKAGTCRRSSATSAVIRKRWPTVVPCFGICDVRGLGTYTGFDVTDRGTVLFHYTRLETALEHILPERRIKLSPLSEMRDPRESGRWFLGMSEDADEQGGTERFESLFHLLQAAKTRFKVLSLTEDSPAPPNDPFDQWTRGYGHPRLWEHYADKHAGVCICFDKAVLVETLQKQLDSEGGLFHHQAVTYEDEQLSVHFSMRRVVDLGGDEEAISDFFASHMDELLFRKLRDWETEVEYRIVARGDHDEPVYGEDIGPAIKYVMLGAGVHASYVPAFRELCEPEGIGLQRIMWMNGEPVAASVPKPGDPPAIYLSATIPLNAGSDG